jgi:polar amino acid transport system substrate-binding protein
MMNKLIVTTATLALLGGMSMAQDVVRLGTEGAYEPYNFIDDKGEIAGFEREVGDELCARAELTCTWSIFDWDGMIPNLVSGNFDVIIAGMSITEERKEVIDFSDNYTQPDPSSFMAMGDVDLSNAVIAAQVGTVQASYVTSMAGATLLEFATADETISAVRNGEADAVLADKAFLEPIDSEGGDLSIVGDDVLIGGGIGLGVRQSDTELRDTFSAAIQSMKDDGSLNALITKWLPGSATF